MKRAYVRVSTVEQNEARQIEGLKKYDIDVWYTEKISGKNADRPELKKMLSEAASGDTIYVHDFSRLARSTKDLLEIVEDLSARGIHLVSNKEYVDTSTPTGKLMLTMIGAIAEFERTNMLERQREGIAIAKKHGAYRNCGRKTKSVDHGRFMDCYNRLLHNSITKVAMAIELGISRPTLDKMLYEAEKGNYCRQV